MIASILLPGNGADPVAGSGLQQLISWALLQTVLTVAVERGFAHLIFFMTAIGFIVFFHYRGPRLPKR
ncbi:hypothetical protein [Tepidicella baoligensis]|uniref:hypothetical protein n=1 Tax=Tepidicella baoligensis TaxID=2707016 RepID=UPI0015DBC23D|nr:hypothetical protein [Tepidicella baoligensis]